MEALIVIAVVVVLALILGVSPELILTAAVGLMALASAAMLLFFILNLFRLFMTHRADARLTGLREHERFKYPWAFYEVEGKEYRNVFPCEVILRERLYPEGKQCRVWFNSRKGLVYDTNAFVSVIVGVVMLGQMLFILVYELKMFIGW